MDISDCAAKMDSVDVARSGGMRPGCNQQQKAADAIKTRKGGGCCLASDHVEPCRTDASSLIVWAPGSATLAAAPAPLRADTRDTVFPIPARGVVTFIPAGRRAQDLANVQCTA